MPGWMSIGPLGWFRGRGRHGGYRENDSPTDQTWDTPGGCRFKKSPVHLDCSSEPESSQSSPSRKPLRNQGGVWFNSQQSGLQ